MKVTKKDFKLLKVTLEPKSSIFFFFFFFFARRPRMSTGKATTKRISDMQRLVEKDLYLLLELSLLRRIVAPYPPTTHP